MVVLQQFAPIILYKRLKRGANRRSFVTEPTSYVVPRAVLQIRVTVAWHMPVRIGTYTRHFYEDLPS